MISKFIKINNFSRILISLIIFFLLTTKIILPAYSADADLVASIEPRGTQSANFTNLSVDNFSNNCSHDQDIAGRTVANIGTYSTLNGTNKCYNAGFYGGADGTGTYASTSNSTDNAGNGLRLVLTEDRRYVGFWWSAGNNPNRVQLYRDGTLEATFTVQDLTAQLTTPTSAVADYFGNPNTGFNSDTVANAAGWNEPYAFVHLRYSAGFDEIRFNGRGFEFDNLTLRTNVPPTGTNETSIVGAGVVTTCADVTAANARSTLRACPKSLTIFAGGSARSYDILSETGITGYQYSEGPGTVSVNSALLDSGSGSVSLSGSTISISSSTVGSFTIQYTLSSTSGNGTTNVSTITVNVEDINLTIPGIILIDPRTKQIGLPAAQITDSTNSLLCFEQVADSSGGSISGSPTIEVTRSTSTTGVTAESSSNRWSFRGTQANVQTQSANLTVLGASNAAIASSNSRFIRVTATPATQFGQNGCETGRTRIIEIRPIPLKATIYKVIRF